MARRFRWNRVLVGFGQGTFVGTVMGLVASAIVYYPMVGFGMTDRGAQSVSIPAFFATAFAGIVAFVSAAVHAERAECRVDRRQCRQCGYNLRHLSLVTWECPECRTPFRRG